MLQRRLGTASVLAARRGRQRGEADVVAPAPVACDRTQSWKADDTPCRRHADAVDAGSAGDGDAPAAFGARPQYGERVVLHDKARSPPTRGNGLLQLRLL